MTLVSLPINPVPAGAVTGTFEGFDGLKLRYARWEPTRGPVRGTICIFPGRGEFTGIKTSVFLEVEGAGDYLPSYSGNLDIMTAAAKATGELMAKRILEGKRVVA